MTDPLLRWRDEFPIHRNCTYLVTHSLGAMHRDVPAALAAFATLWGERGAAAWDTWLPRVGETADLLAAILGAPAGSVMVHQNVTTLLGVLASAIRFEGERRRVVTVEGEFPTVRYLWDGQARYGAEGVQVPSRDGIGIDAGDVVASIDERTRLVAISHVLFRTGALVDVAPIVRRAHEVGAWVLVDLYQSAGTVPLSVEALDVDFAVGGSVKWLCGGPGCCYLYVRPGLRPRLEPALRGWLSHARPFAFEREFAYDPGMLRFLGGSPGVPALYSSRPGFEVIRSIGVEAIRAKSLRQTERMIRRAAERGLSVKTPCEGARRGGTVTVACSDGERVTAALGTRGILVDHRPGAGIRIGPHFYTRDEECDRVVDEIASLSRGAGGG